MERQPSDKIIGTILKHDSKVTSYKIALLRAINDVVLSFPDIHRYDMDVAVPLRILAEFWFAYYWPFVDPAQPILQGRPSVRDGKQRNDMAFRTALTEFRARWQETLGGFSTPGDGFFVIHELRVHRRRAMYPPPLLDAYERTLQRIARAIEMPVRYAGPGEWTVFEKPQRFRRLEGVVGIPGTQAEDMCLVVTADLWRTFRELSLWIEALCIHEWSLFTERAAQAERTPIDRGVAYVLLTSRPDNRRPLTWERNQIDLLLMEGYDFICPWTERRITVRVDYDLDHLVPVSVYPINELWNLVPADPEFNSHVKRDRLPSTERLVRAQPYLTLAYSNYTGLEPLARAIQEDVAVRFTAISTRDFPTAVTHAVTDFIQALTDARNLSQF